MRTLVWFSCGVASAVAAKETLRIYPDAQILYCDTLKYEHPDNLRFIRDCENWFGVSVQILRSEKYTDIFDVFDKTGWLVGIHGARCTTELKKKVRQDYEQREDVHVFGFTAEETGRIKRFELQNPELKCNWILRDLGLSKQDCLDEITRAGIEIPAMYKLGYKNNNCIGCVKGGKGYWNKIRDDFPEAFERMAKQERKMGVRIFKDVWLDELPKGVGRYQSEYEIECGVACQMKEEPIDPRIDDQYIQAVMVGI